MTATTEEVVPYQHVIASLQTSLELRTAELVMANARILARDQTIAELRQTVDRLTAHNQELRAELDKPTAA